MLRLARLTFRGLVPLIVVSLAPVPGAAQTGLLVLAAERKAPAVELLREAVRRIEWPHGPAALLVSRSDARPDQWEAILRELARRGARRIVALELVAPGDEAVLLRGYLSQRPVSIALEDTQPVVATGDITPDRLAAVIAERAEAAVRVEARAVAAAREKHGRVYRLGPVNVTATRRPRDSFGTPGAVTVLDDTLLAQRVHNNVAELFREIPGLDVDGVGTSQRRPMIRGLVGQRVLLMEDGLRLNNSRRRQDSGEITALADMGDVERVEVVRGASSVLYGSDALGGVVNVISRRPSYRPTAGLSDAALAYRYSTTDKQNRIAGGLTGGFGRLAIRLRGTFRDAEPYDAPAGDFGQVSLASPTRVEDTGVRDYKVSGQVGYLIAPGTRAFAKYERYRADSAGFGFVEPSALSDDPAPRVQLLFPEQTFGKFSAGFEGTRLDLPFADRVSVALYRQSNERQFDTYVEVPLGPSAQSRSVTRNHSDIDTWGFRAELKRAVSASLLLTYGVDLFRDRTTNTDSTTRTVVGFGAPSTTVRGAPRVPNASFRSAGAFLQADLAMGRRADLVLGARYQDVRARTRETPDVTRPPIDAVDRTVVGSAGVVYRAFEQLALVGSVGRAFRSPNLVERFFEGPSPEGRGTWIANPNLEPETSLNADLGARYRSDLVSAEAFVFRNAVNNGIRIEPTGNEPGGVTEYQNVNIDELRITGVELSGEVRLPFGLSAGFSLAHMTAKNVAGEEEPFGDGYKTKWTARARYMEPRGRAWIEYAVRHTGQRDDVTLGTSPVGDVIPAFTVHTLRGGLSPFGRQRLVVTVDNLTNELYAESANAAFFRPEAGRNLIVVVETGFRLRQ